uniref:Uncharacterized protein n=1 Tax=viral metagenome TaxID=1070528 RepID=A0A6M3KU97_9ZZZZ
MNIPLIDALFQTLHESIKNSREEVKNPRYGQNGTILFEFRGKTFEAPEPQEILFGWDSQTDKSICLKAVLDKTSKIVH